MIKKIDIQKFGLFNDFSWTASFGGSEETVFKKLNIIYGRNYSGKTTLARILRSIEKKGLHKNYIDGNFSIELTDGTKISSTSIIEEKQPIRPRVYNSDYVKENLGWFYNEDGTIVPFTILGSKNVEVEKQLNAIADQLGKEEEKKGLLFELVQSQSDYEKKHRDALKRINDLESSLKSQANDKIKINPNLFSPTTSKKTYQINDIKDEIKKILPGNGKYKLTDDKKDERKKLLKEQPHAALNLIQLFQPTLPKQVKETQELTTKKIKPSNAITELIENNLLQEWVRTGINLHKNKKNECGFCGNVLPDNLWEKLDAHFSKESEELRRSIEQKKEELKKAKKTITEFLTLVRSSFYSLLQTRYDKELERWEIEKMKYISNLDTLLASLEERQNNIFNACVVPEINDNSLQIVDCLTNFNKLISENNNKSQTLSKDQATAREELRFAEIEDFIKTIGYDKQMADIAQASQNSNAALQARDHKQQKTEELREQKRQLEANAQDESRGAQLVNEHLARFFGHDDIKLVSEGEKPNMKFKIVREQEDAKNLSEGECSLISFCYFIASIQDELNAEQHNDLIIFIDDPISSLDSSHVFFMYSLIDTIIAKPKRYGQLFISTHNLEFLKFLKRISTPDGKENIGHYLIERLRKKTDKRSVLKPMPAHLKKYVTEFNYLFSEIYKMTLEVGGDRKMKIENTYNQFYNLPNNMRKFLECYLFYRYPNSEDPLENLSKLFDGNIPSLVNRIVNEYSHLSFIDRGWQPVDVAEMEECANLIINKIEEKDKDQFDALVASVS